MEGFPRVTVGGDAVGGWLVDIHDGDKNVAYSPEAATAEEAEDKARIAHGLPPVHTPPEPVVAAEPQSVPVTIEIPAMMTVDTPQPAEAEPETTTGAVEPPPVAIEPEPQPAWVPPVETPPANDVIPPEPAA